MKQVKIGTLKDGAKFRISKRKSAVTFKVIKKAAGWVIYSSTNSEKSYAAKKDALVYAN